MIKRSILLLSVILSLAVATGLAADSGPRVPTIDDLLNVKSVGGAAISPDGQWVAYTVSNTDFKQDAFITQIWVVQTSTGRAFQLTRGEKSSSNPRWSPDRPVARLHQQSPGR